MFENAKTAPWACDLEAVPSSTAMIELNAPREDAFWRAACRFENYFRNDLDYEDYAPAYCVGYVGHAQYGGSYADAERCLWANWERIKGDSRLSPHDAHMSMRAAWCRMETLARDVPPKGLVAHPVQAVSVTPVLEADCALA